MIVYAGNNPTELYLKALKDLMGEGKEVSPRGKRILELRPVCFEFTDPLNRVTFLKGREINPFFQLAEALWISSGCADVEFISKFNSNIEQFSDDGEFFNAPYGERLRQWNVNTYKGFVFNPIDQLGDVIEKLSADRDSRQAVAVIYNPLFDNFEYTSKGGKDVPCNMVLSFKIRDEKLDLTVFNRSNDISWGLFGANLCQFSTVQEIVASLLEIPVGTYYHITDSLHVYLDDYGSKITEQILENYPTGSKTPEQFVYPDAPRIGLNWSEGVTVFWEEMSKYILDDVKFAQLCQIYQDEFNEVLRRRISDPYLLDTIAYMFAYRAYKLGLIQTCIHLIADRPDSQWKVSCCKFLYPRMLKNGSEASGFHNMISARFDTEEFKYITGGK